MKEIKISEVKVDTLKEFLKKLLSIDNFIFMKIEEKEVSSAVFFPQKDAVKNVKYDVNDMFTFEGAHESNYKVSFYNASKIIDALGYFPGTVKAKFKYEEIDGMHMVKKFTVYDDRISINLYCGDPALSFMDMDDDELGRAFGENNVLFKFDFTEEVQKNVINFFKLDKEKDTVNFEIKDGKLHLKGSNYDTILVDSFNQEDDSLTKVTIYKKYFSLLDKEEYRATVCANKIIFKSLSSDTTLTVALCVVDD